MAVSPFFLGDDRNLVLEMDRRARLRRVAEIRAARMADVAPRIGRLSTAYPWLEPGVHLSMAQAGVEPDDPVARFAAQGSVYANRYRGMGAYQVGEQVTAGQIAGKNHGMTVGAMGKAVTPATQKGGLGGFVSQVVASATDPSSPTSPSSTGSLYEHGADDEIVSRTTGVLPGRDLTPGEVQATSTELEQTGIRPVVRAATVTVDAPYQLVQANYRTVFRNDVPLFDARRMPSTRSTWEQTTVGQSIAAFAEGDAPQLGSGYFADPESPTEQRRRRIMLQYGNIGGSVITPGRQAAAQVAEPGTRPYNVLSGSVDAAAAIFLDPANLAAGAGSGSRGIGAAADVADAGQAARLVDVSDEATDLTRGVVRAADGTLVDTEAGVDDLPEVFAVSPTGTATRSVVMDAGRAPGASSPIASDPTTLGRVSESVARRRAAGGIDGTRRFVNPQDFTAWLNGPEGTAVVDHFAAADSTYDVWAASGRQMPVDVARRLRDAVDADEVRAILDEEGGVSVPAALRIVPNTSQSRWAYDVPDEAVDLQNIEQAVRMFERQAINAKVDDDTIRAGIDELVDASGREGRMSAFRNLFERIETNLVDEYGLHPRDAHMITRMWDDQSRIASGYAVDRFGRNAFSPGMMTDPTLDPTTATASPLLDTDMLNHPLPMPDFRALRRATSGATVKVPWGDSKVNISRLLLEQGGVSRQGLLGAGMQERALDSALDGSRFFGANPENYRLLWDGLLGFTSFVFKPAALLRPAWTVRVALMDEQFRIAASGLDGLYSHPISAIAWMTGRRGGETPGGLPWDEIPEFVASQYQRTGPWLDEINAGGHRLTDSVIAGRGDEGFARGIADRIATMHASVVGRNTARSANLDDAHRWFFDGEAVPWAGTPDMLTESGPDVRRLLSEAGGDWESLATDPDAARRYLEVVNDQIRLYTGGDADLMDAVRTGQFQGIPVIGDSGLNEAFVTHLRGYLDEVGVPDEMPEIVRVAHPRTAHSARVADAYNATVRTAFTWLGAKPSNYLNRSPVFRQLYSGEMTRLIPWMDADAQARWLAYAQGEGNLGRGFVREIRATARNGVGDVDFETMDAVARAYALQGVEELLYSSSKKGQVADAMRLAFPFGEAWKEMLTTWGRLLTRRPQNARIVEHGLQTASEGFFDENQYGEQVFTYPLSGALTEFLTGLGAGPGTPMPLTGRAQGLSMATEVLPGLGPVAQVPAGWFIDDKPSNDWFAEQILPYGRTTDIRELVVPRWVQRAATGATNVPGDAAWNQAADFFMGWMVDPEQQRTYNNSVMEVMTYLASTGEYEQTQAGLNDLMNDAKRDASALYIMRGLSQSFSPSAPAPDWRIMVEHPGEEAETASGAAVSTWFRERQRTHPDTAVGDFLERFGPNAFLAMQSSSRSVTVGAPVTEEGIQWLDDNDEVRQSAPLTYGLFAPIGGEFNYEAYVSVFELLTPEQFLQMGNNLVGSYLYRTARDAALASANAAGRATVAENQRLWLQDYRARLMDEFPGFDPEGVPGVASSATNAQLVRDLVQANEDPTLRSTEAGTALNEYLRYRSQAMEQAEATVGSGESFATRQEFAPTRAWLRQHAMDLIERYPAFAQMWDRVLDHELDEDLDQVAAP